MSKEPIQVSHISKEFILGDVLEYYTLRDHIAEVSRRLLHLAQKPASPKSFWALDDVSFKVEKGEVLGLIGKNGSGKSTLLKILARIVSPTKGVATITGRVASILEVGTGFHPELSGRENIYLSGAILGLKKREIEEKFDEIVDFADIGDFLDTPTKRYSSGMQVRLAFSVAANLNADILLVDEVLAVGDISFQKKSLQKMRSITKEEGRTVVFVSHSMPAVSSLCSKVILLDQGKMVDFGKTDEIISKYITQSDTEKKESMNLSKGRMGNGKLRVIDFYILDSRNKRVSSLRTGKMFSLVFTYICPDNKPQRLVDFSFAIRTMMDQNLFLHYTSYTNQQIKKCKARGKFIFDIPKLPLAQGKYKLSFRATVNGLEADHVDQALTVNVDNGDFFGTGFIISQQHSPMYVDGKWRIE